MKVLLFISIMCWSASLYAQSTRTYQWSEPEKVESKNFYLTYWLAKYPITDSILNTDVTLVSLAADKRKKLAAAETPESYIALMKFSDEEISTVSKRLMALYAKHPVFTELMKREIIPSGGYQQYDTNDAKAMAEIWVQDARAINHVIDVYGAGKRPNYPLIDSISFVVSGKRFRNEILPVCVQNVLFTTEGDKSFTAIPLASALALLDINDRLQASDYEPLATGINAEAYQAVKRTDWQKYPYTAIVVLGVGPEDNAHITPESCMRAAYAAECWRRGMVPFIITSGGKAHPWHTPYCEAFEMRDYLIKRCHVPDSAIIIDPHARHTTTNLRNSSRIMWRNGFPADRPALVTGSKSHIDYVMSEGFIRRFQKELDTVPVKFGKRINTRCAEFYPLETSLRLDKDEPMDP